VAELLSIRLTFAGEVVYWRGPAPFHFVAMPEAEADAIRVVAPIVSYGWGVIPVRARIGETTFSTSLFPKGGSYLVPIKNAVRHAEALVVGDPVTIELAIGE
jgi:Domain of unknown function (DUF1905)